MARTEHITAGFILQHCLNFKGLPTPSAHAIFVFESGSSPMSSCVSSPFCMSRCSVFGKPAHIHMHRSTCCLLCRGRPDVADIVLTFSLSRFFLCLSVLLSFSLYLSLSLYLSVALSFLCSFSLSVSLSVQCKAQQACTLASMQTQPFTHQSLSVCDVLFSRTHEHPINHIHILNMFAVTPLECLYTHARALV